MAANRKLPIDFNPPLGRQVTLQQYHVNAGNPVAPDHTLQPTASYPNRLVRTIARSHIPAHWTMYTKQRTRTYKYNTPKGKIATTQQGSVPIGKEKYVLSRRMYIYNGKVVTE